MIHDPAALNRRIDEILGQPGSYGPQILLARLNRVLKAADLEVDGHPLELERLDDALKLPGVAVGILMEYLQNHYAAPPDVSRAAGLAAPRKRTQSGTHRKAS